MANGTLDVSKGRGVFKPRPGGATLPMKGEGHDPEAKPIDPDTLGKQIEASNRIEGVDPSGEIKHHLPPSGGSPYGTLSVPPVPKKAIA